MYAGTNVLINQLMTVWNNHEKSAYFILMLALIDEFVFDRDRDADCRVKIDVYIYGADLVGIPRQELTTQTFRSPASNNK